MKVFVRYSKVIGSIEGEPTIVESWGILELSEDMINKNVLSYKIQELIDYELYTNGSNEKHFFRILLDIKLI